MSQFLLIKLLKNDYSLLHLEHCSVTSYPEDIMIPHSGTCCNCVLGLF